MKTSKSRVAVALMMSAMTAAAGAFLMSCSSDNNDGSGVPKVDGDNTLKPIVLTRSQQELVNHSNDFAFKLFREATKASASNTGSIASQSVILSPISVTYALGMLNNGATGETQQQINQVLGFVETGADGINTFCRKMLTEAPALDQLTKVMIANNIYMNEGYELKPTFMELAKQYYDAEPETRDFHDEKTREVINQWGREHTEGMIEEVLKAEEFDAHAVSYLLNAIYFKGVWAEKFDKGNTKEEVFRGEDGTERRLPMMHMEHEFSYIDTELFQMVSLPYGNGAFSMSILLPHEGKTVDDVMTTLTADSWCSYYNSTAIVDLKLPRFESNTDADLKEMMQRLGMERAFTDDAEFDYFCQRPTKIDLMKQVARINLDEAGTEAAAVTVVGMVETAFAPSEPERVTFHANRPFLYVISEESTGTIFFIGQYVGD